jgi:septal ring factor EnvC (AmiA/AmiB activator)
MDASVKQVKALKLELEAMEGKVENARSLEASNASLMREFVDERSAMEMHIASMEEKIASLEEELDAKRDKASSTEKALEEMAALDAVWAQYVEEAASAKKLDGELQTMAAKLADAEASRLKSASQNEDTWAKQIRLLPSQTSSLAMQLKEEANDKARKSKEKMKDYEA